MKPLVAPIVADSQRLLREVVKSCSDFPNQFKFMISEKLLELALDSLLHGQGAARAGTKRPAHQLEHIASLIDKNDRLQAMLDTSYNLKCFKSSGQYEDIIRLAAKVGAQAEGWKRSISSALPNQQNQSTSSRKERLGVLSTDATPAGVNT